MLAEALREVQTAIAAEDWTHALPAALAAWRIERSSELADLIDRITERCTLPRPPHSRGALHNWWMVNAVKPDAVMIGALLGEWRTRCYVGDAPWETIRTRWSAPNPVIAGMEAMQPPKSLVDGYAQGETFVWKRTVPNWVDRAAAMVTWPDDPRVAHALATLLCDQHTHLDGEHGEGPWPAIADRLRTLLDCRIGTLLVGASCNYRARRLLDELRTEFYVDDEVTAPAIAEVAASVPKPLDPVQRSPELAALWTEVGQHPDDDAPRLVLADALLAMGNNRGELIVLQCATEKQGRAETEARRMLKREWSRWFGNLALLLTHRGTEVRRGMLECVRLGSNDTPAWAWEAVAGHHELVAVREVRAAMAPPHEYAKLVAAMPHFPRFLMIDAHEVIDVLLDAGGNRPLEHLYFAPINNHVHYARDRPPVEVVYERLAKLAPHLVRLDLGSQWWIGGSFRAHAPVHARMIALVREIRARFPELAQLRIAESSLHESTRAEIAAMPGVEVIATGI